MLHQKKRSLKTDSAYKIFTLKLFTQVRFKDLASGIVF
jgi:hypothetical protein